MCMPFNIVLFNCSCNIFLEGLKQKHATQECDATIEKKLDLFFRQL